MKEEEKPKGRAAVLAAYKAANPETPDEPDDEGLYDFSNNRNTELEGKYNQLNSVNGKLAEVVAKDPKLAAVLSMIVGGDNPKSFPYAVANVYGKEIFDLDGDALDDFETGYQENLNRLAESEKEREQASKNLSEYQNTLVKYGQDNGLDENQLEEVHQGVMKFADNLLMGIIPTELIDLIYKGLNYEKDVQEAAITGEVEGRNQTIEAKMKGKTTQAPIPDLGNGSGDGKMKNRVSTKSKKSFYDEIQS